MSDRCGFCETKTDTNMLVLGDQWLEFCSPCGETETLTNAETGEVASIKAVFDNSADGTPIPTLPAPPPVPAVEGVLLNGEVFTEWEADMLYLVEVQRHELPMR